MEGFEKTPVFNIQTSLEKIQGVSDIKKLELNEEYFSNFGKEIEVRDAIKNNYESVDAYKFNYVSDGLTIVGYIWSPKEVDQQLPLVVWNRGGTMHVGNIGELSGTPFLAPAELAKMGHLVVASEYRGSTGSEGHDEFGGKDLNDVVQIKRIADQLPITLPGKAIVAGASRGGMMSYLLAAKEPWVKKVVSIAGLTELQDHPYMKETFDRCFGGSDEEMKKRSATYFYESIPNDVPLLILQGVKDESVPVEQVRKLTTLLESSGHTVKYQEYPEGDHFLLYPSNAESKDALKMIQDFIDK